MNFLQDWPGMSITVCCMKSPFPEGSAVTAARSAAQSAISLSGETRDGVLYARAAGLVTAQGIGAIRDRLAPALVDLSVVCLDYSRAALAVTEAGLDALFRAARPGPSALVMAWVVPDAETADVWRRQAARFALAGVARFATHRADEAQAWVRDQARRAAQRRAWRSTAR